MDEQDRKLLAALAEAVQALLKQRLHDQNAEQNYEPRAMKHGRIAPMPGNALPIYRVQELYQTIQALKERAP